MESTLEKKFNAYFCNYPLNILPFNNLKDAQNCVTNHPAYKKSHFGKKGDASSKNLNDKEYFRIYDNSGFGWYIR